MVNRDAAAVAVGKGVGVAGTAVAVVGVEVLVGAMLVGKGVLIAIGVLSGVTGVAVGDGVMVAGALHILSKEYAGGGTASVTLPGPQTHPSTAPSAIIETDAPPVEYTHTSLT